MSHLYTAVVCTSVRNQLQFHVWWLTATKRSMINNNQLVIGIKNLMRFFYGLDILWNNSSYYVFQILLAMNCWSLMSWNFILNKKESLCIGDRKVSCIYLKECCLHIQLIVSFNFGLDHELNSPNQLTFDYNRSSVHH